MFIELTQNEAELLRDLLRERVIELDKEINRTDSLRYKSELQHHDRTFERILGGISAALAPPRQSGERSPDQY